MNHRGFIVRVLVMALLAVSLVPQTALAETDAATDDAATASEQTTADETAAVPQSTKDLSDSDYAYTRFETHAVAYTGSAIKPVPTVLYANGSSFDTLKEGTDFTFTYQDANGTTIASPTDVGIYSVTITGMGSYTGTCSIHPRFAIANSEGGLLYYVGTSDVEESVPASGTGAYVVGVTDGATSATLPKQLGGSDVVSFDIIRNKSLTSIDASAATSIAYLGCGACSLSSLALPSTNTLKKIDCHSNKLTTLDVSALPGLTSLICYSNQLGTLDVSKNTQLAALNCGHNSLGTLDVSNNLELTSLICHYDELTSIDVSKNTKLETLTCPHNQIKKLDLSNNLALKDLACNDDLIATLDVSKNTQLDNVYLVNNYIHGDALATLIKRFGSQGVTPQNDLLSLSKSEISGVEATYAFTGSAITPVPTVTYNGTTVDPEDYSVTYLDAAGNVVSSPTAPGTYTLEVTGTHGIYTGSTSTTFQILAPAATTSAATSVATETPVTATTTGTPATGDPTMPWAPAALALLGMETAVVALVVGLQ